MHPRRHKRLERLSFALDIGSLTMREVQFKIVDVDVEQFLSPQDVNDDPVKLAVALLEQVFRIPCGAVCLIPSQRSKLCRPCRIVVPAVRAVWHRTDVKNLFLEAVHQHLGLGLVKLFRQHFEVCLVFADAPQSDHASLADVGNGCVFWELAVYSDCQTLNELFHPVCGV